MSAAIDEELDAIYTSIRPYFFRNRKDTLFLEGVFMEIIKQLYADKNNLLEGVKRYDPTGECPDSVYVIGSSTWSDTEAEARPAIVVDIGDLQYTPIEGFDQRSGVDLVNGEDLHTRLCQGTVVFAHLGKNKGQSIQHASTTRDLLDGFSRVIRTDFCFERFDLRKLGKPTKRREQPLDYQSLVQADFEFYEDFRVKEESPKLKKVAVTIMTNLQENS